ncbi:MAG: phosphodiester glycosidase family protein [Lachnospirales bacterium]
MRRFFILGTLTVCLSSIFAMTTLGDTLYKFNKPEEISKGVTYIDSRRMTSNGYLNVHVLEVDITDENIELEPVINLSEKSKKSSLTNLLNTNGAIAGINGDYFGMAGKFSAAFSTEIKNSRVVSVNTGTNESENNYASFVVDINNNPFIEYMKVKTKFTVDEKEIINIFSINRVTDMVLPIAINREAFTSTAEIDGRFPNLYKLVVVDGVVTYESDINNLGETVEVPENGYVVLMNEKSAKDTEHHFSVGQKAELNVSANINIEEIKNTIGGAGQILKNGAIIYDTGDNVKGTHPRTAIGISEDNSKVYLVVVDGRGQSKGASHEEMGKILSDLGAYNGMHLDGGGSSAMAVKAVGKVENEIVNVPSDGGQRLIMNGLGVFLKGEVGAPARVQLEGAKTTLNYEPVPLKAYVVDEYNRIIETEAPVLTVSPDNGYIKDNILYPSVLGNIEVVAMHKNIGNSISVHSGELTEIIPVKKELFLRKGGSDTFSFYGVDDRGEFTKNVPSLDYTVFPEDIGYIEGNKFVAVNEGIGYIEARNGDVYNYVKLTVGYDKADLYDFTGNATFREYPENVVGAVTSNTLEYTFNKIDTTEAGYMILENPLVIEKSYGLEIAVKGDNSNNWLRALLTDANGKEIRLDFIKNINFEDTQSIIGAFPEDASFPVALERIYVTDSNNDKANFTGKVEFYDLNVLRVKNNTYDFSAPKYVDEFNKNFSGTLPASPEYDVMVLGNVISENETNDGFNLSSSILTNKINEKINTESYVITTNSCVPVTISQSNVYQNAYKFYTFRDTAISEIVIGEKGITNTNVWQWASLFDDIKESGAKYSVIVADRMPVFPNKAEEDLFYDALKEIKDMGIDVFYVALKGENTIGNKDGIKYIALDEGAMNGSSLTNDVGYFQMRVQSNGGFYFVDKISNE